MATSLFGECREFSVSGLTEIGIMSITDTGDNISFPLDINIKNGVDSLIVIDQNVDAQTVTFGDQVLLYSLLDPRDVSFNETRVEDSNGVYYEQDVTIRLPKLKPVSSIYDLGNKTLPVTNEDEFGARESVIAVFDSNGFAWLIGWQNPLIESSVNLTTGGTDNFYNIILKSNSHNRIFELDFLKVTGEELLINPTDVVEINVTDLTLIN